MQSNTAQSPSRPRQWLSFILRLGVTGGLIFWLIRQGRLDLASFWTLAKNPVLVAATVAIWLVNPIFLGSLRWHLLLKGATVPLRFRQTVQIQAVGLFFNSVMPGAVGGDVVKVFTVIRHCSGASRAAILMTILLDRIIGLFGLLTVALVAGLAGLPLVGGDLKTLIFVVAIAFLALGVLMTSVFVPNPLGKLINAWLQNKAWPGSKELRKLYAAASLYQKQRNKLVWAWIISILTQAFSVLYFWLLADQLLGAPVSFKELAVVFPLGMITVTLPLAPGGIGVGHMAFDRLFVLLGAGGGATVFNAFALGQLALNLLGAIPYLNLRSRGQIPSGNAVTGDLTLEV